MKVNGCQWRSGCSKVELLLVRRCTTHLTIAMSVFLPEYCVRPFEEYYGGCGYPEVSLGINQEVFTNKRENGLHPTSISVP